VVLTSAAFGYIDVDTRHAPGATGMVVGNEASCLYPPDLSARPDNAKLADEFRPPFFERTNVLGAKSLDTSRWTRADHCWALISKALSDKPYVTLPGRENRIIPAETS